MKKQRKGLPHMEITKAKAVALRDITEECGKGKLFTQNFIYLSRAILTLNQNIEQLEEKVT